MKAGFDKERLLIGLQGEDRDIVSKTLDLLAKVKRHHLIKYTDFCNPYQLGIIFSRLNQVDGVSFWADGGYEGAERQQIVICPDYLLKEDVIRGLTCLKIEGNFPENKKPSHRDYLGSLLGLGLKREKIGDILVEQDGARLIVALEVASFIEANLLQVNRWTIKVGEVSFSELELPLKEGKEIVCAVASLRVDAISAFGYGISRSKMVSEIKAQKLTLNWKLCSDPSRSVAEGDVISLKGKGRMEVISVDGFSKKGRTFVTLKRLL